MFCLGFVILNSFLSFDILINQWKKVTLFIVRPLGFGKMYSGNDFKLQFSKIAWYYWIWQNCGHMNWNDWLVRVCRTYVLKYVCMCFSWSFLQITAILAGIYTYTHNKNIYYHWYTFRAGNYVKTVFVIIFLLKKGFFFIDCVGV